MNNSIITDNMFLTAQEVFNLTDLRQPKRQIEYLAKQKYPFEISALGRPKVYRAYFIKKFGLDFLNKVPKKTLDDDFNRWEKKLEAQHGQKKKGK